MPSPSELEREADDWFVLAEALLQRVYPNWHASHVPNRHTLLGGIAVAIREAERRGAERMRAEMQAEIDRLNAEVARLREPWRWAPASVFDDMDTA